MKPGRKTIRKLFISTLLVLVLLGAAGLVYVKVTKTERATAREVQALLANVDENYLHEANPAFDQLQAMGERAYPELRRILSWRETPVHRGYERIWSKAPKFVRERVPAPDTQRVLQFKATAVVWEMGPVACRAVAGAVAESIMEPRNWNAPMYSLRILYWSIPESPKSTLALSNWLGRWESENHMFGMTASYELWPRIAHLAPMLTNWLKNPDVAAEAAASLGAMGTNARFAAPFLGEVAQNGLIGTKTNSQIVNRSIDTLTWNRISALRALGAVGTTNEVIRAGLDSALRAGNIELQLAAFAAAHQLGYELDGPIATLLKDFSPRRSYRTKEFIEETGKCGQAAKAALPWLRQFTDQDFLSRLSAAPINNRDRPSTTNEIRLAAIIAMCRIDPVELDRWLPELAGNYFDRNWRTVEYLLEVDGRAGEMVKVVEPFLAHPEIINRLFAAQVIKKHSPEHAGAREVFDMSLDSGDPESELQAAFYWVRSGGAFEKVLPALRKGLLQDGQHAQTAMNVVERMGEYATILAPELKQCLQAKERGARDWAARVLRKVAPEEMPPIEEN